VFWTVALPNDAVRINPLAGTAEMHVQNLHLFDYFSIPNGVQQGPHDLGTVSFDVSWNRPVTRLVQVRDTMFGFAGTFAEDHASVTWSGVNDTTGFRFRANRGDFGTTASVGGTPFAELGFERNGIFFQPDDSDRQDEHEGGAALVGAPAGSPQDGHDGGAAFARALVGSPAAAVLTGLAPLSQPRQADSLAATPVGEMQPVQQPSVANRLVAPRGLTRALDQVFADPDGVASLKGEFS
jgi:hypothetical protein